VTKGTRDPYFGNLIKKFTLLYCGIQPDQIDKMDITEVELFMIYFTELQKAQMGGFTGKK